MRKIASNMPTIRKFIVDVNLIGIININFKLKDDKILSMENNSDRLYINEDWHKMKIYFVVTALRIDSEN